jgi:hypothetical protein
MAYHKNVQSKHTLNSMLNIIDRIRSYRRNTGLEHPMQEQFNTEISLCYSKLTENDKQIFDSYLD